MQGGRGVLLHHRHRPGIRQRPLPHDPDGTLQPRFARSGHSRSSTTSTTRATTRSRWDRPATRTTPMLEHTEISSCPGVPRADDGPRGGRRAGGASPPPGRSGSRPLRSTTAKGAIKPGERRRHPLHHQRDRRRQPRICLEHVNPVGRMPPRLAAGKRERRLPRSSSRGSLDHPGDGLPLHRWLRTGRRGRRLPGNRARCAQRRAVPSTSWPRWVTPLDLPSSPASAPSADPHRPLTVHVHPSEPPGGSVNNPIGVAMTPEDLVEIELIKRLKYRYLRSIDQKLWDWLRVVLRAGGDRPVRRRAVRVLESGRHHGVLPHLHGVRRPSCRATAVTIPRSTSWVTTRPPAHGRSRTP